MVPPDHASKEMRPVAGPGGFDALVEFVAGRHRLLVLTGAGLSTDSGIPDYRDASGNWKRPPPMQYQEFVRSEAARRRYWARSTVGWRSIDAARPNDAHRALAALERAGPVHHLVTQNVDGLHQRAGSRSVTDLHGNLATVECLACGTRLSRAAFQATLEAADPGRGARSARVAPDGDADLDAPGEAEFAVPGCPGCGGILKPSVVFFGESVPRDRVAGVFDRLAEADGLLVAGSSLMVFSGYRFVREAVRRGCPVAIVNLGRTRADGEATLKAEAPCADALAAVLRRL